MARESREVGDTMSQPPASWAEEQAFIKELAKALERASESHLQRVAEMAVADEKHFYKLVVQLLEKASKRAAADSKKLLHLLFVVSETVRRSRKKLGPGEKYGEREPCRGPRTWNGVHACPGASAWGPPARMCCCG